MRVSAILAGASLLQLGVALYSVQDDYLSGDFFSKFDFFTGGDPTHGFVNYVGAGAASSGGLTSQSGGVASIGVDSTNMAPTGRNSVRLTSKAIYNKGLVIIDLAQMPGGVCGTWPAFWMVGPGWPAAGEIDIIEGVNLQTSNSMTLHTSAGCALGATGGATGQLTTQNCDVNAPNQPNNVGCSFSNTNPQAYGAGFNAAGGGIYATEWTSAGIRIWHWGRGAAPADALAAHPDPSTWGAPSAAFAGPGCDWNAHFSNQQIVFDTTFCGDWAGAVWSTGGCAAKAPTCNDFVANNPAAFKDARWVVNSLKVYTQQGGQTNQQAAPLPAASTPLAAKSNPRPTSPLVPTTSTTSTISTPTSTSTSTTSTTSTSSTTSSASKTSISTSTSSGIASPTQPLAAAKNPIAPSPTSSTSSHASTTSTSTASTTTSLIIAHHAAAPPPANAVAPASSTTTSNSASSSTTTTSSASSSPPPLSPQKLSSSSTACTTPGQEVCSPDGLRIGMCDTNHSVVLQNVAAGTRCSDGYQVAAPAALTGSDFGSGSHGIPAARRRRRHLARHAIKA